MNTKSSLKTLKKGVEAIYARHPAKPVDSTRPPKPTPRNWDAHNREGAGGWVVAPLHPSGDGSHYAPFTQRLTEEDARLIAAAPDLLASCIELLAMVQVHIANNSAEVHRAIRAISKTEETVQKFSEEERRNAEDDRAENNGYGK